MFKINYTIVILAIFLLAVGILFWPTLYRYEKLTSGAGIYKFTTLIRINRVTGYTEKLGGFDIYLSSSWTPVGKNSASVNDNSEFRKSDSISECNQFGEKPNPVSNSADAKLSQKKKDEYWQRLVKYRERKGIPLYSDKKDDKDTN